MGDIGDGDPDHEAAGVGGALVRMGIDRIVMVARVGRVDGDERQVPQVFAALEPRGCHRVGLGDHLVGEIVGNAVLVDGDQRDGARRGGVAEPGDDLGPGQAHAGARARLLGLDQLAVLGVTGGAGGHHPFLVGALVDRQHPAALGALAEDPEDPVRRLADAADETGLVAVIFAGDLGHPAQDPVARHQRRIAGFGDEEDARGLALALPFERTGEEVTVGGDLGHLQHRHRRQLVGVAVGLLALGEMAFAFELAQQALELDPVRPLDPEGLGDVALRGEGRVVGNPGEDFVLGRDLCHAEAVARPGRNVSGKRA